MSLDTEARTVVCDDERRLHYDGLIVATGAAPADTARHRRACPGCAPCAPSTTASPSGPTSRSPAVGARLVVIGAGFIGSEVAATCHGLGARVTVVEALPTPLGRVLGDVMGEACAELHRSAGVSRAGPASGWSG